VVPRTNSSSCWLTPLFRQCPAAASTASSFGHVSIIGSAFAYHDASIPALGGWACSKCPPTPKLKVLVDSKQRYLTCMRRLELLIQVLMLVVCLVPFTSTRQAAIVCAPLLPPAPIEPMGNSEPIQGQPEDDIEREEQNDGKAKTRLSHQRWGQEADPPRCSHRLSPGRSTPHHLGLAPALASPDPFRNGLGTPYRC
jgi:hypothetical protein